MNLLKFSFQNKLIEAGCDEAGRGAIAGPVVAATVILKKKINPKDIKDSKKIKEKKRNKLAVYIKKKSISWSVAVINNKIIDKINILKSSHIAMTNSIKKLNPQPEFIIIDGNSFHSDIKIPYQCIIKGDNKYLSIAAASIIAKTYRDQIMITLHKKHPEYNWIQNKGYPTIQHKKVIKKIGPSIYHRKSFNLFERQLKLKL